MSLLNNFKKARIPINYNIINQRNQVMNKYIQFLNKSIIEIVVARYNEDLNWLSNYNHLIKVYDKGNIYNHNSIKLDNIGREGHTFLYYIINNWENLPSLIFFVQGNISDHDVYPINFYLFPKNHLTINLSCNRTNFQDFWGHLIANKSHYFDLQSSKFTYREWWDMFVRKPKPSRENFKWSPGGIFSVSKDLIGQNSKEYYQNLLLSLGNKNNPEEGHYLERSWYYIFNQGIL